MIGEKTQATIGRAVIFTVEALALALFLILCALHSAYAQTEEKRIYHVISIAQMASENPAHWQRLHTHVLVDGWVTYMKTEADGDGHIRMCINRAIGTMDPQQCIVAEIIPEITPQLKEGIVAVGVHIRVRGIARYDAERGHGWWEVHPVESLEVAQ